VFLRALFAFLALPGVIAFAIPLLLFRPPAAYGAFRPLGAGVLSLGLLILALCVRDFYVLGKGTLAPWDPPRRLVIKGLYRYSRNPMYVGVLLIVAGWALGFQSIALMIYALGLLVAFHLRVVLAEEPFLARTHGPAWIAYSASVPRWVGRRHLRLDPPAGQRRVEADGVS
jgi:protein-S-isoprenylcysteine O-methyltransferase Ste14